MSVASPTRNVDPQSAAPSSARQPVRVLRWSLRIFGSVDLLATVAVVMPEDWLRAVHALCGLGEFPPGPLPLYLARSTSMLYAFHGAILWCLSTDVPRYCPVIRFIGGATVLFGTALVFIDRAAGIPPWWTWSEGPVFAATGFWLLGWTGRIKTLEPTC